MFLAPNITSNFTPNRLCFLNMDTIQSAVNHGADKARQRSQNPEMGEDLSFRERLRLTGSEEELVDNERKIHGIFFGNQETIN